MDWLGGNRHAPAPRGVARVVPARCARGDGTSGLMQGIAVPGRLPSGGPAPSHHQGTGAGDDIAPTIRQLMEHIELHFASTLQLADMAQRCNLSLHRFATVFRRQVGLPPHQYLCLVRVRAAHRMLRQGMPPADVAIEVGFFDQSHLSRHFKRHYGMTPGRFAAARAVGRG